MLRMLKPRRRGERGAVLIMSAILSSLFILVAAFAVDLGMQRVTRRDMQALADVVALDMARQLDGVTKTGPLKTSSAWQDAKAQSVARNNETLGDDPVVDAVPGTLDAAGKFVPTADTEVPTAVKVLASSKVDFNFAGGAGGAGRVAVAAMSDSACYGVGSFAVRLATQDSALLNGLLGDALDTTALGYSGLVDADVSLLGLTAALTAGSPNGVLDTSQVKLGDFVLAAATALTNAPGSNSADVGLLHTINAQLDFPNQLIDLGDLLDVGTGNMSAVDTNVNVLDMLYGAAIIANGNNFVHVPALTVSLPNVTNVTTELHIIEAPQSACNGASASTSQVGLRIRGELNANLVGASVTGDIDIQLDLATATATLADVHCTTGTSADSVTLELTDQTLASARIDFSGVGVKPLVGSKIPLLGLERSTTQPNPSGQHTLPVPTYYYPNTYKTPQGANTLSQLTSSDLSVWDISLGGLLSPVLTTVLNPIITQVNSLLTNTVSPILGLNLAGADLFVYPEATCGRPTLKG
jgi:uncharacterized membrane protein